MQITLKLSLLMLCVSLVLGITAPRSQANPETTVIAGCPASQIACPDPKPKSGSSDKKKEKKGKKGKKG